MIVELLLGPFFTLLAAFETSIARSSPAGLANLIGWPGLQSLPLDDFDSCILSWKRIGSPGLYSRIRDGELEERCLLSEVRSRLGDDGDAVGEREHSLSMSLLVYWR